MGLDVVVVMVMLGASGCVGILGAYYCNKYICGKGILDIDNSFIVGNIKNDDMEAAGEVIEDNAE